MNTQSKLVTNEPTNETAVFSAPLEAVKKGHLKITSGASNFDLRGNAATQDLFQAQFTGWIPDVYIRNGRVTIRYRLSLTDWFKHAILEDRQLAEVSLNASIPWQIDIHGGVSRLDADLRTIQLRSLEIIGGVSGTEILLPRPLGTVPIHIMGGVSQWTVFHPDSAPVRLQISGGASKLTFDSHFYGSIGNRLQLETPDYRDKTDRYDIRINGGVSNLTIRAHA